MLYRDIMKAFYRTCIRYLIAGGLAVNLHGVPRVTQDVDIVIAPDRGNITALNRVLKELGYIPRLPVDPEDRADPEKVKNWVDQENLNAFSFLQ